MQGSSLLPCSIVMFLGSLGLFLHKVCSSTTNVPSDPSILVFVSCAAEHTSVLNPFCRDSGLCPLSQYWLEVFTRAQTSSVWRSSGATSVQKNSGSPQFSLSHKSTWTGTSPAGTAHTGARSLFLAEDFTAVQFSIDIFKLSVWVKKVRLSGPKLTW